MKRKLASRHILSVGEGVPIEDEGKPEQNNYQQTEETWKLEKEVSKEKTVDTVSPKKS